MKNQKQDDMSLPLVFMIFVGVLCFTWFLYLPGDFIEKWSMLSAYILLKQKEIFAVIGIVAINLALLSGIFVSVFGLGRLGQKIKGYYLKKTKSTLMWVIPLMWIIVLFSSYWTLSLLDVAYFLRPLPKVIPGWQSDIFFKIAYLSLSSLISLLITGMAGLFLNILKKNKFKRLPKLPKEENILILGTINER